MCSYVRQIVNPCGIAPRVVLFSALPRFDGPRPRTARLRSRELQRLAWGAGALLWMFAAAPVSAQNSTGGLTLTWDAPPECPDRGVVLDKVAKHLREERKFPDDWRIEARVVRRRAQFELELNLGRVGAEPARRTLRAPTCAALVEATAVFVALALESQPSAAVSAADEIAAPESIPPHQPSAAPGATAPAPSVAGAPHASATQPPAKAPAASPSPAVQETPQTPGEELDESTERPAADGGDSEPLRLGVGVGAGWRLDTGMLPTPQSGLEARIELRVSRLRAVLGFNWVPPVETVADAYPGASIRASAILGEGLLGYALVEERFSLVPCAAFEYGALSLASRRIAVPDSQNVLWGAAGAGAHAAYRIAAGFELNFEATGLAPFSRPRLWLRTDRGDLTLFQAAAVAVRISAGIAYVFE